MAEGGVLEMQRLQLRVRLPLELLGGGRIDDRDRVVVNETVDYISEFPIVCGPVQDSSVDLSWISYQIRLVRAPHYAL